MIPAGLGLMKMNKVKPKIINPAAFLAVLTVSASACGQVLSDCRLIDNDANRLMCYDLLPSGMPLASTSSHEHTVMSFSGEGTHSTRSFVVPGPWEVQWSGEGKSLLLSIHDAKEKILGSYGAGERSSSGHAFWPNGGVFSLEVITGGRWKIEIQNVP
jgi:hypothetical protein